MPPFSDKLIGFYQHLKPPSNLPREVEVLFSFQHPEVMQGLIAFYKKYFQDSQPRRMMLGINPGRFGAGITGINFTAPKQLKENCGIPSVFKLSSELSAEFIYQVIDAYGGTKKFYQDWFIGAVCPLGFMKDSKNLNYYDDAVLLETVTPFIIRTLKQQIAMGFKTDFCLCIGGEKNYRFLTTLNKKYHWFQNIIPLPHPRFIMQYRRRHLAVYIQQYLDALRFVG